jgi:hypothetical protein
MTLPLSKDIKERVIQQHLAGYSRNKIAKNTAGVSKANITNILKAARLTGLVPTDQPGGQRSSTTTTSNESMSTSDSNHDLGQSNNDNDKSIIDTPSAVPNLEVESTNIQQPLEQSFTDPPDSNPESEPDSHIGLSEIKRIEEDLNLPFPNVIKDSIDIDIDEKPSQTAAIINRVPISTSSASAPFDSSASSGLELSNRKNEDIIDDEFMETEPTQTEPNGPDLVHIGNMFADERHKRYVLEEQLRDPSRNYDGPSDAGGAI